MNTAANSFTPMASRLIEGNSLPQRAVANVTRTPRLIRIAEVLERTGLKRAKLYQLISRGQFPKPIKVDACSLWSDAAIDNWVSAKLRTEPSQWAS